MRRPALVLVAALLAAACGDASVATSGPAAGSGAPASLAPGSTPGEQPVEQPKDFEQSFEPPYTEPFGEGFRPRVEKAWLSHDGQTVTVQFDGGGAPYLQSNPCSADYAPWVVVNGEALDVVIYPVHHEDQAQLGPNMACAGVGHLWTFHLGLAEPFLGKTVNDVNGGGTVFVAPPGSLAVLGAKPFGWTLQKSFQLEPGPPPMWIEIYAAHLVEQFPDEGSSRLVLYQAFGIVGEWSDTRTDKAQSRGASATNVIFRGKPAKVWVDQEIGEMLLAWDVGGRSYGLIGNSADMTVADLVRYAESVTIPS